VPQETPYIVILNKQKYHFFFFLFFLYKIREEEDGTGPAWRGWYRWAGEGGEEMVKEGEYGANAVHMCVNGK
jgi:hypothetical protein